MADLNMYYVRIGVPQDSSLYPAFVAPCMRLQYMPLLSVSGLAQAGGKLCPFLDQVWAHGMLTASMAVVVVKRRRSFFSFWDSASNVTVKNATNVVTQLTIRSITYRVLLSHASTSGHPLLAMLAFLAYPGIALHLSCNL